VDNTHRRSLYLGDLGKIIFVINAITQDISKVSQCAFQSIRRPFFLGFLECGRFALAILDMAIANILPSLSADILEGAVSLDGNRVVIPREMTHP
jgi:hypothetical protein